MGCRTAGAVEAGSCWYDACTARATPQVSAAVVKQLRDKSGAGMMDCKKALAQCGGDIEAAADFLRKKGLASADKKSSRVAAEGAVGSYIHAGSRLGVLVEVNCETDFVARGDTFKALVQDIAMQVRPCGMLGIPSALWFGSLDGAAPLPACRHSIADTA